MAQRDKFIVLLRHGIAENRAADKDDFDRRLTDIGNQRMKRIARALVRIFPDADTIYSSPLIRCVETAAWVAKAYGGEIGVMETDSLTPGSTIKEFRELLSQSGGENLICVGHEPNLSTVMLEVTGMRSGYAVLKKGGSYGIRLSPSGEGQLEWMLPPRIVIK